MENSTTGGFAKTGQALADKAPDKAQGGIRSAQEMAKDAGNVLLSKIEDVRSEAGTAINRSSQRLPSASKQGLAAISETAGQARDVASNAADSIVSYTKQNPIKALAIAVASGAVLYAISRALTASRD